jgi:mannose-6-phosphate isomerase-like protein (cupin superfamily)
MHQYGIQIDKLQTLVGTPEAASTAYGTHAVLSTTDDYRLEQFVVQAGSSAEISVPAGEEWTLFVEEGIVKLDGAEVVQHKQVTVPAGESVVTAQTDATLYAFIGAAEGSPAPQSLEVGAPEDYRDKYWGNIQTMVNALYTGKRLFFAKGQHSSLHYHCQKLETYYIHSGELLVRLRAGRGEDRLITLKKGNTLLIPPGLMHQDGGLEDTVIIEVSTHDEDSDSFIVEDGATTDMPGFPS